MAEWIHAVFIQVHLIQPLWHLVKALNPAVLSHIQAEVNPVDLSLIQEAENHAVLLHHHQDQAWVADAATAVKRI